MALGNYTVSGHTIGLAEKLSGGTWVTETVPSPAHGWNVYANEVVCASSSSCLFVGQHWAGTTDLPATSPNTGTARPGGS